MKPGVARFYWSRLAHARCVLDLGCGSGDFGRYKPAGVHVYGIDVDRALVEQANENENETAQVWDLDSSAPCPFADAFFDAVVAKDVLEHLQKPWRTVGEIKRVLRPDGLALASVICERGRRTWSDYTHVRGFTMLSLRKLFTDAGFEVLGVWRMGAVPLTSRLNAIWLVPYLLRFPLFDWVWTSSYEIVARAQAASPSAHPG